MPDKEEKQKRRLLLKTLQQKAKEDFESSLPMSAVLFRELFDYLDIELSEFGCDHTLKFTTTFLTQNEIINIDSVKE